MAVAASRGELKPAQGRRDWLLGPLVVISMILVFAQPWRPARVEVRAPNDAMRGLLDAGAPVTMVPQAAPSPGALARASTDAGDVGASALSEPVDAGPGDGGPDADVVTNASADAGDWHKYPIPSWCVYHTTRCTTPKGEPGIRCREDPVCFNPCPRGKAVHALGMVCLRRCRSNADCPSRVCTDEGLCERSRPCEEYGDSCMLPNNVPGHMCNGKCTNPCAPGKVLYGGTHCTRQCWTHEDCRYPNGRPGYCERLGGLPYTCSDGLCPSEACPIQDE